MAWQAVSANGGQFFTFMRKLILAVGLLVVSLLATQPVQANISSVPVYYNTSSATTNLNTLDRVGSNGGSQTTLFTASGSPVHCTAMAVDGLNGKLFFIDATDKSIWSVNLDGSGLTRIQSGVTSYPTDLVLDVLNEQIYFTTSSTIQNNNTVQRMDYTGSNLTTLFTATGGSAVSRCTALAVDVAHSKMFVADVGTKTIWSMSLAGGSATALVTITNAYPTDLAAEPTSQMVYFTVSSTVQTNNCLQRVSYGGANVGYGIPGLTTLFTASGSVQRCTALDLDVAHSAIYLSDAGNNAPALWRIPLGGGSASSILSGLTATAKKVRYYSGQTTRPAPALTGISLSGGNVVLNATNGIAGGTYYVLTSTNVAAPLSQWLPVFTNVLSTSGSFILTTTNGFSSASSQQFYILQVH